MAKNNMSEAVALSVETLGDLDNGIFGILVNKGIDSLTKDVDDRGEEDGKIRTLTIQVDVVKTKGIVIITPKVQAKLPPRVSNSTAAKERMKSKGQPELTFQPHNADNAEQRTLDDGSE